MRSHFAVLTVSFNLSSLKVIYPI